MFAPPEGFRHVTPVEIRFADMDAMGHVNNAAYQTYVEMGRTRYYADLGLMDGILERSIGPVMAKAVLEYRLPLALGDEIMVYTRCSRLGAKSYDIEHRIVRHKGGRGEIALSALMTAVMYNHRGGHSVPIPETWRERILAYEPVKPI